MKSQTYIKEDIGMQSFLLYPPSPELRKWARKPKKWNLQVYILNYETENITGISASNKNEIEWKVKYKPTKSKCE